MLDLARGVAVGASSVGLWWRSWIELIIWVVNLTIDPLIVQRGITREVVLKRKKVQRLR